MKKILLTQTIKIKDLGKVITGTTPPTANQDYFGGKYLFIKPSDISEDQRYVFKTEMTLSDEGYKYQKIKALPKNSICVVCIGTIGKKMCLTSQICFTNQQLNSIAVDISQYDPIYTYYLVRTYLPTLKQLNAGSSSGRENVNKSSFENIELEVHELPTQRKIASILSVYDDLIENNTRRIKILEEMAQMLYREWFVNFRFPDHENVKMVESELGLIPEGWKIKKLGDIASINSLSLKATNAPDEINYIDISSVSTGQIDKVETIDFANAPSRARRIVKHGDIIWATVRPNRKSYSLILNPSDNLIVSTGFAVITARKAPYTYLYKALTTDSFVDYLTNNATGSAYPAVNSSDFKNADIVIPDKFLLDKYHNIVVEMLQQKQNLQNKNINLRKTRDLLLPKLISGEIDVENLDIETLEIAA
ncbi:restriction endonuclease subunit S [Pseudanabaena sp. ABRG5-3]|uniref:restriction endonuclease subunit S n=1 Tax=Pseudanabaena sp. ABRG5-3 TaxID=685565 RepID=UPI000DC6FF30|nr:restriction endonuclease subunit S [Pseudanabaena sp. ABRG5-3]BBC23618.1 restriction modification system DNA specificity domain [Pseudanabaena sp. ABRG5-3]